MNRSNIAVVIKGNNMPEFGRRWDAYKTACNELALQRNQSQRNNDRKELKAGGTLCINGYLIRKCS
jgi:hypothetical protein